MVKPHLSLACLFVVLLLVCSADAMDASAAASEPRVRAREAKAICVALAAFQASAPRAKLRHYAVHVGREGKNYHIVFSPDPGPGEAGLVGGETKHGAVIGYVISHRTFRVLGSHYAK